MSLRPGAGINPDQILQVDMTVLQIHTLHRICACVCYIWAHIGTLVSVLIEGISYIYMGRDPTLIAD